MSADIGNTRRYDTLCRVLDSLCHEAPSAVRIYHPPPGNQEKLIQARSRALLHLFLKARFGLLDFAARERCITDGPHDGGIDAYFINKNTKTIYVLQSKFRATAGNFVGSNVSAEDLLKMDIKRVMSGATKDELGQAYNNQIRKGLQKSLQQIPDVASYTTRVAILGNLRRFTSNQLKKLVDGYPIDQFPHRNIYDELMFPVIDGTYYTEPDLTIKIDLADPHRDFHLNYDVTSKSIKSNVKLLFVPTIEIGRIMSMYKNSILTYNPRSFLELRNNVVNQEIESSLRKTSGNEFALFNNGITIISDKTSLSSDTGKQGTAQVVLHNPQLVNGGQTAYTLSRIYEASSNRSVFKGKEVLLRIVTFIGATSRNSNNKLKLISDISRASNSQTKIDESDRRSNDEIQIRLQRGFFQSYGLYYERKRGEFSDGRRSGYISNDTLINRETLVRVALASEYRANQARTNVGRFFKKDELTRLLEVAKLDRYAYAYQAYRLLAVERKAKPPTKGDRYNTRTYGQGLRYGQYAMVAVCVNFGLKANKTETEIVVRILPQWKKFEAWAQKRKTNKNYRDERQSFDFVNYYKGATINADLQKFKFSV
jgi:AIPR protein